MFKKLIILGIFALHTAHAMDLKQAQAALEKLMNSCVYSQEQIFDQKSNTYYKTVITPLPKNYCDLIKNTITKLDPQTRMLLLFNDQNFIKSFATKNKSHKPLSLRHSNQEIFACLQTLYKDYEPEMYVAFITKNIEQTMKTKFFNRTIQAIENTLPLLPDETLKKVLMYKDKELLAFTDKQENRNLVCQKKVALVHDALLVYYKNAKLM